MNEKSFSTTMHEREESRLVNGKAMAPESQQMVDHMQAKGDKSGIGEDGAQTTTLGDAETTQPASKSDSSEPASEATGSWHTEP